MAALRSTDGRRGVDRGISNYAPANSPASPHSAAAATPAVTATREVGPQLFCPLLERLAARLGEGNAVQSSVQTQWQFHGVANHAFYVVIAVECCSESVFELLAYFLCNVGWRYLEHGDIKLNAAVLYARCRASNNNNNSRAE